MTSDARLGRRNSRPWPAAVAFAAATLLLAALPAAAGGYLPLGVRPPAGAATGAAVPVTWFTDRPEPEDADPAKDPCISATGQLRIAGRFLGTASLVLDRRVVLTASHVPWLGGKPQDRFTFMLGFDRGKATFTAEATVVARGSYYSDSGGTSHYRASDWAVAVLDKPAPADVAPLAIYQGQPEDLLGRRLWVQGYAVSYAAGAAPFIARGCAVEKIDSMDGRLHNSCSADHGTSGAPLMTMQRGACSVAGIQAGGLADQRPAPFTPRSANIATSPKAFRHAAKVVQELLASGMDAEEIKASLGMVAALDLP
jgi:V8-like Glu-specific endopeptidase